MKQVSLSALVLAALVLPTSAANAEAPDAISVRGEALVATVHAVGSQVYECRFNTAGNLVWQFREPIASLFIDGKTVGRHYAGPHWEMSDGSVVRAKVAGNALGASHNDIPLLKLEVTESHGSGHLSGVTTIQRLNTRGGFTDATCNAAGTFLSVPYTADYAFYRKMRASLPAESFEHLADF